MIWEKIREWSVYASSLGVGLLEIGGEGTKEFCSRCPVKSPWASTPVSILISKEL